MADSLAAYLDDYMLHMGTYSQLMPETAPFPAAPELSHRLRAHLRDVQDDHDAVRRAHCAGVTAEALHCFAEGGFDALIAKAIAAATARGAELAKSCES